MQKQVVNKKGARRPCAASVEFRLVIERLEARLLEGRDRERIGRFLAKDRRWEKMNSRQRLKWAYLAQLAGRVEAALEILAAVNRDDPENSQAWKRRLELLAILGRQKEIAALAATAGKRMDTASWKEVVAKASPGAGAAELEAGLEPFLELEKMRRLKQRFGSLFYGRRDCFARQWADRRTGRSGYVPVRRPMEPADLEDHFSGKATYGIYLMLEDSSVKTAVVDADLKKSLRGQRPDAATRSRIAREKDYLARQMEQFGQELGSPPLVEFSGAKGYHFWFFFQKPLPAGQVRQLLEPLVENLGGDLACFQLELFPKQDSLEGRRLGNLVKLPLGVHRLSGKRSYFPACRRRDLASQLELLESVRAIAPEKVAGRVASFQKAKVVRHPVMQKGAGPYPELEVLESGCPALAAVMRACRRGLEIGLREEKILFQTIGFLERGKSLLHYLLRNQPEYNPHLVDFKLSRLRGSPLGCRRIHSLLDYVGNYCCLEGGKAYQHPLLHLGGNWKQKAEKIDNLQAALDNLEEALGRVRRFLK